MPSITEAYTTTGTVDRQTNSPITRKTIRVRCDVGTATSTNWLTANLNIPPQCRIEWMSVKNAAAIPFIGAATPNAYMVATTAPTSLRTQTATTVYLRTHSVTTQYAVVRGTSVNTALAFNTTTSEQSVYVVPYNTTGTNTTEMWGSAASQCAFGTGAQVDLLISTVQFDDPPSA